MKTTVGTLKKHKHSGLWFCRYKGKPKYLGTRQTTEAEAEAMRQRLISDVAIVSAPATINETVQTIGTLLDYYLKHAPLKDGTKNATDRRRYVRLFSEKFSIVSIRQVLPYMVEQFIQLQPWSDTTKCNFAKHLAAAFNWLIVNRMIELSPMKGVKRCLPTTRGEEYIITEEEYKRLLPLVASRYQPIVEILWNSGCRPEEILSATVAEYDATNHELKKQKHKTKHKGKYRNILLNNRADQLVIAQVAKMQTGLLFTSVNGKKIAVDVLCQYMRRVFKRAKITHPVCNYSFRHSAAVRWIEAGIPIETVASWLGNTVGICWKHYAHCLERTRNTRHLMPN